MRSNSGGGQFSTNETNKQGDHFHRSKSPIIDQTIMSTIGGPSFNSIGGMSDKSAKNTISQQP